METHTRHSPESRAEVIARLLHQGGRVLLVGGGLSRLDDKYLAHPRILVWDDTKEEFIHKEVPSNTRAILFNSSVSHSAMRKLRRAAKSLHITLFPLVERGQIKEALSSLFPEPFNAPIIKDEPMSDTMDMPTPDNGSGFLTRSQTLRDKLVRGEYRPFFHKHLKSGPGVSANREAIRLVPVVEEELRYRTTKNALAQAIRKFQLEQQGKYRVQVRPDRSKKVALTPPPAAPRSVSRESTPAELLQYIKDGRDALDIVYEWFSKNHELVSAAMQLRGFFAK